jgi:hypothetical protein
MYSPPESVACCHCCHIQLEKRREPERALQDVLDVLVDVLDVHEAGHDHPSSREILFN